MCWCLLWLWLFFGWWWAWSQLFAAESLPVRLRCTGWENLVCVDVSQWFGVAELHVSGCEWIFNWDLVFFCFTQVFLQMWSVSLDSKLICSRFGIQLEFPNQWFCFDSNTAFSCNPRRKRFSKYCFRIAADTVFFWFRGYLGGASFWFLFDSGFVFMMVSV